MTSWRVVQAMRVSMATLLLAGGASGNGAAQLAEFRMMTGVPGYAVERRTRANRRGS